MARLPIPGSDANNWGTVLNDYLQQALASDGTLVTAATNSYTSTANTNLASGIKPGLVQLVHDLGGTATSPSVVALHGYSIDASPPNDGNVLTWSTASSKWQSQAPAGGSGGGLAELDGGSASSNYGGLTALDAGSSS